MSNRTVEKSTLRSVNFPSGPATVGTYFYKSQQGGNSPRNALRDNPYQMTLVEYSNEEVLAVLTRLSDGYELLRQKGTYQSLGFAGLNYGSGFTWQTDDEYKLLAKLVEKLRDHSFNAAVFGGEAKSSFNMIAESATRIATAFRYVKRGDVTRAARALGAKRPGKVHKDAGNNWLELQYGWLPLLGDTYEAGKAVASILDRPRRTSLRVSHGRPVRDLGLNLGNTKYKTYISKQVIVHLEEDYSKVASLGLLDPELVAWELLPYSFVADWFLPIGNFLEYRAVINRTKGRYVTTTLKREQKTGGAGGILSPDGNVWSILGGSYQSNYVNVVRELSYGYSVPLPAFQNPLDLSWKRCVSAIALLQQRFK